MARRLMSRRGGSASQPQVTPYQQLELDDGWREWENTKQELVLVKRQLTEKDALVLQLKTASRRLQETLRKKDKDLQAAFAILRSPQDAKTTKSRKQELVDRLVSECMQRAATSEALAEDRRRELDRLKYSSKFLRFQELEVEIEECHTEIARLRTKLETTAATSPTVIAGKLKVSAMPLSANSAGVLMKKTKLDPLNLAEGENPDGIRVPANLNATKMYSSQSSAGQVRVIPLAKYEHREGFVSKTRRRALEAEYYKQVRLAQLEVECELEENLHIRAAREAKKLQAIDQQDRHTDIGDYSARSQQAGSTVASGNNDPNELASAESKEANLSDTVNPAQSALQQAVEDELNNVDTDVQNDKVDATVGGADLSSDQPEYVEKHTPEEPRSVHTMNDEEEKASLTREIDPVGVDGMGQIHSKQKMCDDDEFDASNDDENGTSKEGHQDPGGGEHSVWNLDPNPQHNRESDEVESAELNHLNAVSGNDESSTVWNVDPNPSASTKTETGLQDENTSERVIWNLDRQVSGSDAPAECVQSDNLDDVPDTAPQLEDSVPSDDSTGSNVWSLDPNPPVPETIDTQLQGRRESVREEESSLHDNIERGTVWNLDPAPSLELALPVVTNVTKVNDSASYIEIQPVWNLDPEPVADTPSSPIIFSAPSHGTAGVPLEVAADESAESNTNTNPDATGTSDPELLSDKPAAEPTAHELDGKCSWNLDPDPSGSSPISAAANVSFSDDDKTATESEDLATANKTSSEIDQRDPAQSAAVDQDATISSKVWTLDSTAPAIDSVDSGRNSQHDGADNRSLGDDGGDERSVWNLDPHTGDASEPAAIVGDTEFIQEEVRGAATSPTLVDKASLSRDEEPQTDGGESALSYESQPGLSEVTPTTGEQLESDTESTFDDGSNGDMAEVPEPTSEAASNESSPRASEADSPMQDGTPDYTPPSTARDSEAGDEEDSTW